MRKELASKCFKKGETWKAIEHVKNGSRKATNGGKRVQDVGQGLGRAVRCHSETMNLSVSFKKANATRGVRTQVVGREKGDF